MIFALGIFVGGNTSYGQFDLEIRTFAGHLAGFAAVAVTPDGRHVISGGRDATVKLWELETGALIRTFEGRTNIVTEVAATPDRRYVVSSSYDRTVRLWEIETTTR